MQTDKIDSLNLRLIGSSRITIGVASPLRFRSKRAEVLVAYLAITRQTFGRESLATWLWGDSSQKQALANLRRLLARLPDELKLFLAVDKQVVALDFNRPISVDLWQWEQAVAQKDILTLLPLLNNFHPMLLDSSLVRDSWSINEWLIAQQAKWQQTALVAFRLASQSALHHRNYEDGIRYAQTLVSVDPLLESSHRLLMRLFVRHGQRTMALRQFEQCRQVLHDELAVTPDGETVALYERIRHSHETAPHHVPLSKTPFVGRDRLLARVQAQLDDPTCRLLTLVGMGGSGKTRLALQTAHDRKGDYLNGIFWVSLAGVTTQIGMLSTLASSLLFDAASERSLQRQLIEHLQDQEVLLIFDNFEQVIDAGVGLLQALLEQCRRLQIVVTSRERLQIRAERQLAVGGVDDEADGVALFELYAGREADNSKQRQLNTKIWQICQQVEGLPLGIELAAAALAYHSLEQISAEITTSATFLHSSQRDRSSRHRSIDAVFDYSWRLLSDTEQHVFANCALFLGGFSVAAARAVAGAKLQTLYSLVDKSMLRVDADGRFHVHELLREFSAEKITNSANIQEQAARYFLDLLSQLMAAPSRQNLAAIATDWENIQQAWLWCLQSNYLPLLNQVLDALSDYFYRRNSYQVAVDIFGRTLASLPPELLTQARIYIRQARFHILLSESAEAEAALQQAETLLPAEYTVEAALLALQKGSLAAAKSDYAAAEQHFQHSLTLCPTATDSFNPTDVRHVLVLPTLYLGKPDEALRLAQAVVGEYAQQGNDFQLARARTRLANVVEKQGDWRDAEKILRQNLTLQQELGDELGVARTYALLADKLGWQEQYEEAIAYCRQALEIYYRLGAPLSIAIQLGNLGTYYHVMGQYGEAQSLYEESLRLSNQLCDRMGMVYMLQNLGELCQEDSRPDSAVAYWERSLTLSLELNVLDRILNAIAGLAITRVLPTQPQQAYKLLQFVQVHPATFPATIEYVKGAVGEISAETTPDLTLKQAVALCQP